MLHDRHTRHPFVIYGLVDPRDGVVRYIGKSCYRMQRAWRHITPTMLKKEANTHKTKWVKKLLSEGVRPLPVLLEVCKTAEDTGPREIQWIKDMKTLGVPLTNATDGGDGTPGRNLSPETRAKISAKATGRVGRNKGQKYTGPRYKLPPASTETRLYRREAQLRRMSDPVKRAKIVEQLAKVRETRKKPIVDGQGNEYPSIREAARMLGLHSPNIVACLQGKTKTCGGRTFQFKTISDFRKELPI